MDDTAQQLAPTSAPAPQVEPASAPSRSGLTAIVVAVVVVAALYFGREVLIPITLALLLSFVLSPLVELLRRVWLGRIPSVIIAVLLALGIIVALGSVIGSQVAQLAGDWPRYEATIEKKLANLRENTIDRISGAVESLRYRLAPPHREAATAAPPAA